MSACVVKRMSRYLERSLRIEPKDLRTANLQMHKECAWLCSGALNPFRLKGVKSYISRLLVVQSLTKEIVRPYHPIHQYRMHATRKAKYFVNTYTYLC